MPSSSGILATADQRLVEERALRVLQSPVFQQQVGKTRARYADDPSARIPGGASTLELSVNELAWAAALIGVNADPTHPAIAWVYNAPHTLEGRTVPGSRWGIDNPDNVYRIAPVDGTSQYRIRVRRQGRGPTQFSFMIYSHFLCEDGHEKDVDAPLAILRSDEVQWTECDAFTLTIDAQPANGRPNHLQSTPDAKQLLMRDTLADWRTELPLSLTIERVAGPAPSPLPDEQTLAERSAYYLEAVTNLSLNWKKKSLFGHWQPNTLCTPYGRGGAWGFAASGDFQLQPDEALVVTVDPLDAQYIGFELCNLWLASLDHVDRCSSLNGAQAEPNKDGTFTYVIAAKDPGFVNWLDTCGLLEGSMLYRWQALRTARTSAAGAIRSVQRVKLDRLRDALPADARFVTPDERARSLATRQREYSARYAGFNP
jgi:hypothetical protein